MVDGTGIFTNIDAFVKYLNEHGETESTILAQTMGVGERNIEEWAKVLESSKMARITYKLGRMFIAPMTGTGGGAEEKQTEEVKKAVVSSEIDAQLRDIDKIMQRIGEFKKNITASENVINENSAAIRKTLDKIDGFRNEALKSYNEIKNKKDQIDRFSNQIGNMIDSLSGKTELDSIESNRKNASALISDLQKKIDEYHKNLEGVVKGYDSEVKKQRENILKFVKDTKAEVGMLHDMLKEEENGLKKFDSTYKSYKQEAAKAKKIVEVDRTEIMDKTSKAKAQLNSIFSETDKEWKDIEQILSEARNGLSGFEDMQSKMAEIRKQIEEAENNTGEIKKQIESISQRFRAVGVSYSTDSKEKIGKIDSDALNTSRKIRKEEDNLTSIKKDIEKLTDSKE